MSTAKAKGEVSVETDVARSNAETTDSRGNGDLANGPSSTNANDTQQQQPQPQYRYGRYMKWEGDRESEDDSIHYLSEPSQSEGENTNSDRPMERSLLSTMSGEESYEDTDGRGSPPPPPPAGPPPPRNNSLSSAASNGMASPSNTSLSSRESYFPNAQNRRVVRIHFSPDPSADRQYYPRHNQHYQHFFNQPQNLFPPQNNRYNFNNQNQARPDQPRATQHQHQQQQQSSPTIQQQRTHSGSATGTPSSNHLSYSTFSMSTMSASVDSKQRQKTDAFINNLRQNSEGALMESTEGAHHSFLNTSTEDSATSPSYNGNKKPAATLDTVLRVGSEEEQSRHHRISSVETELIGNTSDAILDEADEDPQKRTSDSLFSMDDSQLMLNLSLLGDDDGSIMAQGSKQGAVEEELDNNSKVVSCDKIDTGTVTADDPSKNTTSSSGGPSSTSNDSRSRQPLATGVLGDSIHTYTTTTTDDDDHRHFDSHHSADDEQTHLRPPRLKRAPGKPSALHRRTRSGDGAAAALSTGGVAWKGMSKDKIPIPDYGDEDDEEYDGKERKEDSPGRGKDHKNDINATVSGKKKHVLGGHNNNNKITYTGDKTLFSVGAAESPTASRVAARKQRRETRQQQRGLLEQRGAVAQKAARAAMQRQIRRQYQEWSHSPLWTVSQQHNNYPGHMDASEASIGSVPSTIDQQLSSMSRGTGSESGLGGNQSNIADGLRSDDEVPQKRSSLDTLSTGPSMARAPAFSERPNRGSGLESRDTSFSWLSASNRETGAGPSPNSRRQTIHVHPNWTPQAASLVSPVWHRRKRDQGRERQARHQRSQTAVGAYPLDTFQSYAQHEQRDSFRRYLLQQQIMAGHESFRRFSEEEIPQRGSVVFGSQGFANPSEQLPISQHESSTSKGSSDGTTSSDGSGEEDDEFVDIRQNRASQINPNMSLGSLERAELAVEAELLQRGSAQHVIRHHLSPFANFGRKQAETGQKKFDRASFLPKTSVIHGNDVNHPTYRCPRCQTIQREFFTVNNAPRQFQTGSSFLALSFVIYVIASLYIFGLEEGWPALDCIYFAVITLTTAGLGDFVPTSDFNKIICSIFIYFGVACIGLLLGSYIAGMLDETSRRQAEENRLNACPNCARLQNIKDAAEKRHLATLASSLQGGAAPFQMHLSEHVGYHQGHYPSTFVRQNRLSPIQAELDDDDAQNSKKIKRQHEKSHDGGTPSIPMMPSPSLSEAQSAKGSSTPLNEGPSTVPHMYNNAQPHPESGSDKNATISDLRTDRAAAEKKSRKMNLSVITTDESAPLPSHLGLVSPLGERSRASPPKCSPRSPAVAGQSPSVTPRQSSKTPRQSDLLGSPLTKQILGRQSHTRHASIDLNGSFCFQNADGGNFSSTRSHSDEAPRFDVTPTISEDAPFFPGSANIASNTKTKSSARYERADSSFSSQGLSADDDSSVVSSNSSFSEESVEYELTKTRVRTAKYVFLTLKEALVNSMVIIAVGCLGFWIIEDFSIVDSWYFTTVLLTTVGYGDISPITKGGKLFATIYILVAGTILLNNMSLISMIPLELRKRRIERAVLTQFGDLLDDDALEELASGPLIQRLHLSANRADGLNECTREMFAIAMLVRLGKVTEEDILETFHAFNRLDVNRDGVLNSRSIIAGMIHKSRSRSNLASFASPHKMRNSSMPRTPAPMYGENHLGFANSMRDLYSNTPNKDYGLFSPASRPSRVPNNNYGATAETSSLLHNSDDYDGYSRSAMST